MHLVTFLGTGHYRTVTYVWDDGREVRRSTTHLFPLALAAWLDPERVLVLLTAEAERGPHWQTLRSQLGSRVEPVPIPPGRSEAELWEIFDRLAGALPEGSSLVIDVTHGFRSLPLFAAVAAVLLRDLRNVTLERIVYGAYEARDPEEHEAPVFDLTPLLDLVGWLSGIEALERSGDGRLLAQRLRETQASAWRRGRHELPRQLQAVGTALEAWSEAIRLNRPVEAAGAAHLLGERLGRAREELARWAPPFALLADRLAADVAALAHPDPETLDRGHLQAQLAVIRYALEKGLVLQAVTMAREWLVSWFIWSFMPEMRTHWRQRAAREQAERILGELGSAARQGSRLAAHHPHWDIGDLWNQLGQLRNDLAHCGMRTDAVDRTSIPTRSRQLVDRLQRLLDSH
ncbi:TIGR02221 family CRISPR-associated protein [Thermomicrobium sp. 4228-Ro]|uniref:TIGR02221 family CRISPR-associated protein n=1 Tax=Thermomicrobium sp. 4228-Ro TaxID=2993937 RepID=UPI0022496DB0|nr:TIGR02221 family CRISPR-associated protein [Thermomicrobium sp. 4228-Ro]MCX2727733.1 TIGR02221 family CRISPR-associated protein [Thermomicrobium sp. 4228-Ro]